MKRTAISQRAQRGSGSLAPLFAGILFASIFMIISSNVVADSVEHTVRWDLYQQNDSTATATRLALYESLHQDTLLLELVSDSIPVTDTTWSFANEMNYGDTLWVVMKSIADVVLNEQEHGIDTTLVLIDGWSNWDSWIYESPVIEPPVAVTGIIVSGEIVLPGETEAQFTITWDEYTDPSATALKLFMGYSQAGIDTTLDFMIDPTSTSWVGTLQVSPGQTLWFSMQAVNRSVDPTLWSPLSPWVPWVFFRYPKPPIPPEGLRIRIETSSP